MSLEFSKAKNQSLICSYNGIFLHSSYNPEKEAQRFVENLKIDFIPQNIILIEPALAYCVPFLKEKFPTTKFFAIRFIKEFFDKKNLSDFNFDKNFFEKEFYFLDSIQLENDLFNFFGEEQLLNSFFISLPTTSKIFKEQDESVWKIIKVLLKKSQSILATRQFFATRWINNQINFFSNIQNFSTIDFTKKINFPILICASGPSIKNCLSFIKQNQNNFFILACSSAISFLLENQIIPDLCISTDGGYYAKKHLNCLLKNKLNIPLAISTESNIPKKLFYKNTIIPLSYNDTFENILFKNFNIDFLNAKRNGTISGTALELAFSLTDKNIFLCGVDLEESNGFCHTQPNELENDLSSFDNKIKNKETRIFNQSRDSESLKIYRQWFINNSAKFKDRVFRLSNNYVFKNDLNFIKDVNLDFFENNFFKNINSNENILKHKNDFFTKTKSVKISTTQIKKIFSDFLKNDDFIKKYFPADFMMIERSSTGLQKEKYKIQLNKKLEKIKARIKNDL